MLKIITSLFLLGFSFGWGPCLASCGPLIISYVVASKKNIYKSLFTYILFSLARILAYVILASLFFYFGRFAHQRLEGISKYILFLGGLFIMLVGILTLLGKTLEFKFLIPLYKYFLEQDKKSIFLLGLIVGFSPCGPLFALFSYIGLISRKFLESALYSAIFGLGTFISPLLLLVMIPAFILRFLENKPQIYQFFRFISGLIIIFLGSQLIFR